MHIALMVISETVAPIESFITFTFTLKVHSLATQAHIKCGINNTLILKAKREQTNCFSKVPH